MPERIERLFLSRTILAHKIRWVRLGYPRATLWRNSGRSWDRSLLRFCSYSREFASTVWTIPSQSSEMNRWHHLLRLMIPPSPPLVCLAFYLRAWEFYNIPYTVYLVFGKADLFEDLLPISNYHSQTSSYVVHLGCSPAALWRDMGWGALGRFLFWF